MKCREDTLGKRNFDFLGPGGSYDVEMSATPRPRALVGAALSLRDFINRSRVLTQYRSFLRELRGVEKGASRDLLTQVRDSFKRDKGERDRARCRALMAEGEKQLVLLRTYAGSTRTTPADTPATWVGTGDATDIRGRVGSGWPWGS